MQVATFSEIVEFNGDLNVLKRERRIRQQGRKYVMNEGDVVSFDFFTPAQLAEQRGAHLK